MAEVTSLVLAGGRSRRMGRDKRFLEIDGETLLARACCTARAVSPDVRVLVADTRDADILRDRLPRGIRLAPDRWPGEGPLAALAGVLGEIPARFGLLLACDQPYLTAGFLGRLVDEAFDRDGPEVVVPKWRGRLQTTCALYARRLAPALKEALEGGERSLVRWLRTSPGRVVEIDEEEWNSWGRCPFLDVDGPEEYAALLRGWTK